MVIVLQACKIYLTFVGHKLIIGLPVQREDAFYFGA
jgi:hypothetical protein